MPLPRAADGVVPCRHVRALEGMRECLSVSPLDLYYYYNDNPDPAGLASREHNCAAHEDRGLLSVIALSPVPGLQLKVPAPPRRHPATPQRKGHAVKRHKESLRETVQLPPAATCPLGPAVPCTAKVPCTVKVLCKQRCPGPSTPQACAVALPQDATTGRWWSPETMIGLNPLRESLALPQRLELLA